MKRINFSIIIIAFLMGVLLTQYLVSRGSNPSTHVTTQPEQEAAVEVTSQPVTVKQEPASSQKIGLKINHSASSNTEKSPEPQVAESLQVPAAKAPKYVNFTLDDYSIGKLERNINELSVKVKMLREERGWRVQYVAQPNTMASLGLFNNNLILHEVIESARANRDTVQLIERMENVFEALR